MSNHCSICDEEFDAVDLISLRMRGSEPDGAELCRKCHADVRQSLHELNLIHSFNELLFKNRAQKRKWYGKILESGRVGAVRTEGAGDSEDKALSSDKS